MMFTVGDHQLITTQDYVPNEVIDWSIHLVLAPEVWKITRGEGVTVAVLDTGIDVNHPDLKENIAGGMNFTSSDQNGFIDF